jgi:hypothetical protein
MQFVKSVCCCFFPSHRVCFQLQNNIVETQIIFVTLLLSQDKYLDSERKIEIKNRNEFEDDDG